MSRTVTYRERGFTLIELLVVVAIIGILAAIAIPQFAQYRQEAFNSTAQSLLREVITLQEAFYNDYDRYAADLFELDTMGVINFEETEAVILVGNFLGLLGFPQLEYGDVWFGIAYHPSGNAVYCFSNAVTTGIVEANGFEGSCPIFEQPLQDLNA